VPSSPSGYDRHFLLPISQDRCRIALGFDVEAGTVQRFLVQLQWQSPPPISIEQVARIDHNPGNTLGHDVRAEGIHVDVVLSEGGEVTMFPAQPAPALWTNLGRVIDLSTQYLEDNAAYFLDVRSGAVDPRDPPSWP